VFEFSAFSTLRSTHSCPLGSKGYYEVEILGLDSAPQYGFATAGFERVRGASIDGVGDESLISAKRVLQREPLIQGFGLTDLQSFLDYQ
jgi:hypothetical protein